MPAKLKTAVMTRTLAMAELAREFAIIKSTSNVSDSAIEKLFNMTCRRRKLISSMLDDGLITDSYINSIKPTCVKNIPKLFMGVPVPAGARGGRRRSGEGAGRPPGTSSPSRSSTFMGPPERSPASRATSNLKAVAGLYRNAHLKKGLSEGVIRRNLQSAVLSVDGVEESQSRSAPSSSRPSRSVAASTSGASLSYLKGDSGSKQSAEDILRWLVDQINEEPSVRVTKISADMIARRTLKGLVGIAGQYSCEYCSMKGLFPGDRDKAAGSLKNLKINQATPTRRGILQGPRRGGWLREGVSSRSPRASPGPIPCATSNGKINKSICERRRSAKRVARSDPPITNDEEKKGIKVTRRCTTSRATSTSSGDIPPESFHLISEGITKQILTGALVSAEDAASSALRQILSDEYESMTVFSEMSRRTAQLNVANLNGSDLNTITLSVLPALAVEFMVRPEVKAHVKGGALEEWQSRRVAITIYAPFLTEYTNVRIPWHITRTYKFR